MKEQNNYFYDFQSFRIDTSKRSLLHDGQDLQIKSKAFETLLFLVRRPGEIISKGELMTAVWNDTFVEENNLTQQISALRKKLKDYSDREEYIITVPKQGYKFVQPVREIRCGDEQRVQTEEANLDIAGKENIRKSAKPNPFRALMNFLFYTQMREITLGCILMMVVIWFSFQVEDRRSALMISKMPKSIAVLEFRPLDNNEKSSLYSAGITRTLTAKIGNLETMILRPAGTSERFYGQERDVIAIGNELQADIVLEGSVQNEGELVRIAVIAWDSKANCRLWGNVFTGSSSNLFTMQDEIAKEIISAVQGRL